MSFFLRVPLVLSIALAVCACGEQAPLELEGDTHFRSGPGPAPTRYIGVLDMAYVPGCTPDLPSWDATELFSPNARGMMSQLDRYCVYTWTGTGGLGFSPGFISRHVRLDPDPNILVPQAVALPSQVRAERTLQALGAAPISPAWNGWSSSGAYVAIIDNADSTDIGYFAPSVNGVPRVQLHGSSMRRLIDAVRCPFGVSCREWQFFQQAFPYEEDDAHPHQSGGELGSLGSLASAIGDSMFKWKQADPDWHLVINMSLGWDPAFQAFPWSPEAGEHDPGATQTGFEQASAHSDSDADVMQAGSQPGEMLPSPAPYDLPPPEAFEPYTLLADSDPSVPAPVQAVYAALAWAACEGALSIAASGNNIRPRCEQQGPMAPASWEVHPISTDVCAAFGIDVLPEPVDEGPADEGPVDEGPVDEGPFGQGSIEEEPTEEWRLVYAAGGLDAADRRIVNARPGSMPRRALYATQVNVPGGHDEPLTGTSLSAAALSAIAAQLWSQRPDYSAAKVMQRIDASGTSLSLNVDWGTHTGEGARRIDAHAVLAAAGVANPYLPRSSASVVGPSGTLAAAIDGMLLASQRYPSAVPTVVPGHHTRHDTDCAPAVMEIYGDAGPPMPHDPHADETRPQPTVPICPKCPVRYQQSALAGPQWTFYLDLPPELLNSTIQPTLTFWDDATNGSTEVQLDAIASYPGPMAITLQPSQLPLWLTQSAVTTGLLGVKVGTSSPEWHVGVVEVVP